jgi:3-dehydroquinate dehydratase/shikimate dehydrogenase
MRDVYRYDAIGPKTRVYGVVADPVAHSLSPRMHNGAFAALGLNWAYVPMPVAPREPAVAWIRKPQLWPRPLQRSQPSWA